MKPHYSCCQHRGASATHSSERRQLLGMASWAAIGILTGCGDRTDAAHTLAPVEITSATSCDLDGMLLADYHGGKVLRFGDVKADMVDLSGGALHDTRM